MKRLTTFLAIFLFALTLQGQKALTYQVFSEDFQTVYDAYTENPTRAISLEMDAMVRAIGTYWDSLDVFYLFANHTNDNDEALINWKDPGTFDATNVSATAYVALEGFTGDGAADYLNLNWNGSDDGVNYALNDASIGVYCRLNIQEDGVAIGAVGNDGVYIYPRYATIADKIVSKLNDNTFGQVTNTDSRGFFITTRNNSANKVIYKNKVGTTHTETSTALVDRDLYVFAANDGTPPPLEFSTNQVSVAFAGKGMSQTAITTITDAVEGYMDSNSKGVISGTTTNPATPYKVLIYDGKVLRQD